MTASGSNFESEFFTWLRIFLKDKELQFSQCGFKNRDGLGARHEIDLGVTSRVIVRSLSEQLGPLTLPIL